MGTTDCPPADLGFARFVAAFLFLHATFRIVGSHWNGLADPAADLTGLSAALAWAIIEHPGRSALALAMFGRALWNPARGASRRSSEATDETIPPTDEGDSWAIGL